MTDESIKELEYQLEIERKLALDVREQRKIDTGNRIKTHRKLNKMTQRELASKINKTESSIRKYEKGLIEIPTSVIDEIASALNILPEYLTYGKDKYESMLSDIDIYQNITLPQEINRTTKELLSYLGYSVNMHGKCLNGDALLGLPHNQNAEIRDNVYIDSDDLHIQITGEQYLCFVNDIKEHINYLLYKLSKNVK